MDEPILDLREILTILWRRRLIMAGAVGIALTASLVWSATNPKVYAGYTELVVRPVVQPGGFSVYGSSGGRVLGPDISIESQAAILSSPIVAEGVRERLGIDVPAEVLGRSVRVSVVTDELLGILSQSDDPQRAADLANAFATEYLEYRRIAVSTALNDVVTELQRNIDALTVKVGPLDDRIVELTVQIAELEEQRSSPERARAVAEADAEIKRLEQERQELLVQVAILRVRLEEVRATRAGTTGGGEIVAPALVPAGPRSPDPVRDGLIGLALGLAAGTALVFARHRLDDRIRTYADARREITGAPIIGAITRARGWRRGKQPYLALLAEPDSPAAESYRSMRQGLVAMGLGRSVRTVLVTSGGPRAGKSSTAANLAVSCARAGMTVLVVSADLRRPRVASLFGLSEEHGLSDVLAGDARLDDVIQATLVEGVQVVPAGHATTEVSRALDDARLSTVLEEARDLADVVIVDSPPLASGADPLVLAARADLTLLVVRRGSARASATNSAVAELRDAGSSRIGVVVNLAEPDVLARARYAAYRPMRPEAHVGTNGNGHGSPGNGHEPANGHVADGRTNGRAELAAAEAPARRHSKPRTTSARSTKRS